MRNRLKVLFIFIFTIFIFTNFLDECFCENSNLVEMKSFIDATATFSQKKELTGDEALDEAMEKYAKAEASRDRAEREKLFNESLKLLLSESQTLSSGKLFYNIGNIYAYLGEYGSAIAFYRLAENLMPRDQSLRINLQKVVDLAEVKGFQIEYPVIDAICLRKLSFTERELLLLASAAFALVFFSLNLWFPFVGFKWFSRLALGSTLLIISFLMCYYYFVPPRAVVLKATGLRLTEKSQNAPLFTLHPGEMVEILDMQDQNDLVRIRTATSIRGYLPREVLCCNP